MAEVWTAPTRLVDLHPKWQGYYGQPDRVGLALTFDCPCGGGQACPWGGSFIIPIANPIDGGPPAEPRWRDVAANRRHLRDALPVAVHQRGGPLARLGLRWNGEILLTVRSAHGADLRYSGKAELSMLKRHDPRNPTHHLGAVTRFVHPEQCPSLAEGVAVFDTTGYPRITNATYEIGSAERRFTVLCVALTKWSKRRRGVYWVGARFVAPVSCLVPKNEVAAALLVEWLLASKPFEFTPGAS